MGLATHSLTELRKERKSLAYRRTCTGGSSTQIQSPRYWQGMIHQSHGELQGACLGYLSGGIDVCGSVGPRVRGHPFRQNQKARCGALACLQRNLGLRSKYQVEIELTLHCQLISSAPPTLRLRSFVGLYKWIYLVAASNRDVRLFSYRCSCRGSILVSSTSTPTYPVIISSQVCSP